MQAIKMQNKMCVMEREEQEAWEVKDEASWMVA
jgi:hypothetical protein